MDTISYSKKARCTFCNKKGGITIKCECGNIYCLNHRQKFVHNCSLENTNIIDNKTKDNLIKSMKCVSSKVEKI